MTFDEKAKRRRPPEAFYLFTMKAGELRALAGIERRQLTAGAPRVLETGIQRQLEPERSDEIARFVENGYPWSDLAKALRDRADYEDLRKPGWLPTAIVVNILTPTDPPRKGKRIKARDSIRVADSSDGGAFIELPEGFDSSWKAPELKPIEVIDGQHRLWSFEEHASAKYELPVVAFVGLDISWQAYLFWTINIKPKRINPSLAFDLYPLLRTEDFAWRASAAVSASGIGGQVLQSSMRECKT
jgi:hypothetical protein